MTPKRGDRVAPPAGTAVEWELRFATTEAVKGWEALCQQAPANTAVAWRELRSRPDNPMATSRHHRLKGRLASGVYRGVEMEQWQYEVTSGGRLWYLVDDERRTLWLRHAGRRAPIRHGLERGRTTQHHRVRHSTSKRAVEPRVRG